MSEEQGIKTNQSAVPVVLQNLPPAETLNQMIDNLNYLCRVFDDAFTVIETQVANERKKIISIQERVQKASEQTELIAKYPNKSTTVHSHCEFPENINNLKKNPNTINLDDDPLINMTEPTKNINRNTYNLSISQRLQKPPNIDTLQLYSKISEVTQPKNEEKIEGLGTLPKWINSVGETLLFNTDQNPYLKYSTTDNLFGKDQKDRDKESKELFAAPKTIASRKHLNMDEIYDIGYQPELENVPTFAAPAQLTALTSLGNLALDLKWGSNNQQQSHKIAPSGIHFEDLPQLEALPDFADEFGFGDYDDGFGNGNTQGNIPPPKPKTPPPQPPQQQSNQQQPTNIKPPAPPSKPAPAPTIVKKQGAAAPIKKKSSGGGRANLLASIRAGKQLKKSSQKREPKSKNGSNKKRGKLPPKPVSMMDMLKLKLAARNKIMRGKTVAVTDDKNEMAPPKLDDEPKVTGFNLKKTSKKQKKDANKIDTKTDKTGLGLHKLPEHMRKSMIIMDDSDPDEMSSGSWND